MDDRIRRAARHLENHVVVEGDEAEYNALIEMDQAVENLLTVHRSGSWDNVIELLAAIDSLATPEAEPPGTPTQLLKVIADEIGTTTECVAEGLSMLWFVFTQLKAGEMQKRGKLIRAWLDYEDGTADRPAGETVRNILAALNESNG